MWEDDCEFFMCTDLEEDGHGLSVHMKSARENTKSLSHCGV